VLLMAFVLLWWSGAGFWAGTGIVALCYYPQLARAIRRRFLRGGRLSASGSS
jgi:hypothetical protein